jgi:O-antigen/teichoic acid export membrane protein
LEHPLALKSLFKVGSMTQSLGVYLPATVLQKGLGLGRTLLFIYLLKNAMPQYGLWGVASMIFSVGALVVTLGTHLGLQRYTSLYEARGQFRLFYRRVLRAVPLIIALVTAAALAASPIITKLAVASKGNAAGAADIPHAQELTACILAIINAMLLALQFNMLSLMYGLRAYRLVSALDIFFSIAFTVLGLAAAWVSPTAASLLAAHGISLAATVALGMILLHRGMDTLLGGTGGGTPVRAVGSSTCLGTVDDPNKLMGGTPMPRETGIVAQLLRYGWVAAVANLLWMSLGYVSPYLINRDYGKEEVSLYWAFFVFSQTIVFLADAIWGVVLAHVAKHWETQGRDAALQTLQTVYKAAALAILAVAVIIYVSSPLWVKILPAKFQGGLGLLGGQLMLFATLAQLALMTIIARLQERPWIIAAAAAAGGAATALLAQFVLMPIWSATGGAAGGAIGAAWAGGLGVYAGAGAVTILYFQIAKLKLTPGTLLILAAPAILALPLILPTWTLAPALAILILLAAATPAIFSNEEKQTLRHSARQLLGRQRECNEPEA